MQLRVSVIEQQIKTNTSKNKSKTKLKKIHLVYRMEGLQIMHPASIAARSLHIIISLIMYYATINVIL